ncbi:DUF4387 family protein [Bradyrhizobium sp. AUGA SZCCT0222]|uniref:DUF4387 family protein n=1 Tax=Bradyrhizobium sp. AUGA SZCCT0222 TaxID=2807668 RepID=UPI001BA533F1|nr:DUF4387 family protein [Bradyrhizobium sp. AUGA SZCCT0222]MBR1267675.1 DUF4387 family protein [Bradyrhizobium sp. AUGA SZCCT0222]
MPKLVYRVISACGALGYGYPKESLEAALQGQVDAIICDAGSMDAGPYYLGTGTEYFEGEAVKLDFRHMVEAGARIGCPVILGSCGMAGGDRNLDWMIRIAKEVFAELGINGAKVAVIRSELDPEIVIKEFRAGALRATGAGPDLDEDALRDSTIVGQMGIHPLITALESGAQYILAGRSCDVALFASDMIRRNIDPGLAYHVGHVLECGALACDPGSPSDCLVAEVYDDGSATFTAPNPARRCTAYSIAAHSLYEESHPQLQYYPEGILAMEKTQFFSRDSRSAGIRNSRFVHSSKPWPCSIKLEGSRRLGSRKVSLIHIDPADLSKIPADVLLYGRNGVQLQPVEGVERELGIIVETTAKTHEAAVLLASLLTHYLIHYGYPGRKATAGNIAYPLSPNLVSFSREDSTFGAIVPSGTRDPVFFENYAAIKAAVLKLIADEFPDALENATFVITDADASHPVALLRTVDPDPAELAQRHQKEIDRIKGLAEPQSGSLFSLDAPDAYGWSLYHLLQNEDVIKNTMFPITYFAANGGDWTEQGSERPRYFDIGDRDYRGNVNGRTLSLIADHPPMGAPIGSHPLLDMAVVIRSKDAGINRLTFDIIFTSGENYEAALHANVFTRGNVAEILGVRPESVVGSYFVDSCNAIKISIDRPNISASMDERDVFGAQQQVAIERMSIPIYSAALARASSF